jgi:hypothetical protein
MATSDVHFNGVSYVDKERIFDRSSLSSALASFASHLVFAPSSLGSSLIASLFLFLLLLLLFVVVVVCCLLLLLLCFVVVVVVACGGTCQEKRRPRKKVRWTSG